MIHQDYSSISSFGGQAYYSPSDNQVVIAYKGTDQIQDLVLTDLLGPGLGWTGNFTNQDADSRRFTAEVLERAIVDAHHHLLTPPAQDYPLAGYAAGLDCGHRFVGSVYVECRTEYSTVGPPELASLGETIYATKAASGPKPGGTPEGVMDAIVGYVDLRHGGRCADILARHIAVAGTRFKGIRNAAVYACAKAFVL